MSNLALGQTVWNRVFREMGLWCALKKDLEDKKRKLNAKRARTQVFDFYNNGVAFTSLWTFSGIKIGTNTDEDGFLYVRLTDETPGAGQATVDLYKAVGAGAGNKVATGSAADNGTITLAAANSSGLTGTVKISVVTASESNDLHKLQVFPDWPLRGPVVWDLTVVEDADSLAAWNASLVLAERSVDSAISAVKSGFTTWLQGRWADLMNSGQSSPISNNTTIDGGAVSTAYIGSLEDGRINMRDETSPSAQSVRRNAFTIVSGVFDSQNQGLGAMAPPSAEEWAQTGTITCTCIDGTVGAEQFSVVFKNSITGVATTALNSLQVEQQFSDPLIGIHGALLTRTFSFDSSDTANFATAADYAINGESAANTNDGTLYMKIVVGVIDAAKWKIQFYSASTYTSGSLVAETGEAAANTSVGINQKNGKGITGTAKIGTAPVANSTRTLKLNTFRSLNVNGVADKFVISLTVTSRGEFTDRLAELFNYHLNSAASGSETINEGYARAGSFPAYSVRDV